MLSLIKNKSIRLLIMTVLFSLAPVFMAAEISISYAAVTTSAADTENADEAENDAGEGAAEAAGGILSGGSPTVSDAAGDGADSLETGIDTGISAVSAFDMQPVAADITDANEAGQTELTDEDVSLRIEVDDVQRTDDAVNMSVSYGFRNIAKSGRMLPVEAVISNESGADINGRLVIEVSGNLESGKNELDDAVIRYSFDAVIGDQETVRLRNTISLAETQSLLRLQLYDENETLICERNVQVSLQQGAGQELLIGVLSQTAQRLDYFKNINVAGTALKTRLVELEPDNLPVTASGLEQLDIMIVSNLDIEDISEESIEAIRDWVNAGGILLAGTGNRPEAAMELGAEIGELSIGAAEPRTVNMGIKYSKSDPDDATISLVVCDVFAAGGIQVMQSDDIAMLTTVQLGNGIMGIAAYDLCDINEFCREEMEYTDDILSGLLGQTRITQLTSSAEGGVELYRKASEITGIADAERMPNAALYIGFCLIYLSVIGAGIYFYLKSRGLAIFYHAFVPIAAFMSAIFLWLMSSGLRNDGISFDYAVIRELHDGYVADNGVFRLSSSDAEDYKIELPADYEVHPVMQTADTGAESSDGSDPFLLAEFGNEALINDDKTLVGIYKGTDNLSIDVTDARPFDSMLFEYTLRRSSIDHGGIETDIICFNGELSGTLTNNTGHSFSNALLLMYGKLAFIGDINAGETLSLDDKELLEYPIGGSAAIAGYATGTGSLERGSMEYAESLRESRILSHYIDSSIVGYFSGIRFIAFTEDTELLADIYADTAEKSRGTMLIESDTKADFEHNGLIWSSCLEIEPKLVSGEYAGSDNTTTGSCILEYYLGSRLDINSLYFEDLDAVFETDEIKAFSGRISFYNYQNGRYETMGTSIAGLNAEQLEPYLSPSNTITVRYTIDDVLSQQNRMYLPVPYVTGSVR